MNQPERLRKVWPNPYRIDVALRLARDVDTAAALLRGDPVPSDSLDQGQLAWLRRRLLVRYRLPRGRPPQDRGGGVSFAPELPLPEPDPFPHTWRSIDLVAAAANPPDPPTIAGLLYPGKRTLLSGERDSLKTWLALILAKAEIDAGYAVGWADFDAMGPSDLADRLRLLGVADAQISRLFLYYAPAERLAGDRLADVTTELRDRGARLFVADAFNPFLSLHGLDPGLDPGRGDVLARGRRPDLRRRCGAADARPRRQERGRARLLLVRVGAEGVRCDRPSRHPDRYPVRARPDRSVRARLPP